MKLAYLLNSYPMTSTTFIRREIAAIEETGVPVTRYAVRHWDGALVDPLDLAEQERTHYLLTGNTTGLFLAFLAELLTRPHCVARALPAWFGLIRAAKGRLVQHVAYLMQAAALRRETAKAGITHLHCHFSTNATAVAMLSRLMGGPAYSFTVHGPDELIDLPGGGIRAKIENAHAVIAITRYCRGRLTEHVGENIWDRIHIVHCGLKLEDFPDRDDAPAGSTLVCVGRLCPQKGQVHIPAAVAEVRKTFPDLHVTLIGDGESRAAVEAEIAKHDVADAITLAGWRSNAEVRTAIEGARSLLLPSYAEGLPIVIMEAFAMRRPALTTTIAGIPELVDASCGWLVAPGDHDALVAAMSDAMAAPPERLAAMGVEGRKRVEAGHDLARIAPELVRVFGA
ncbi:colanic acid biosynthesis glycosyltransferase WcaL [Sphingomonas sp. DBB INV C78]|uniref:glycosyltransferase family 4 protein n=1 Tax=Sphingomonas sp. DBB INV C78 TaxID=3349434 RepID=UPI0036D2AC4E